MTVFRALLRNGFFGVVLAYVLAAQALLAGPLLAAPVSAAHEFCFSGDPQPHPDRPVHGTGACCAAACHGQSIVAYDPPAFLRVPMRRVVPVRFDPFSSPSREAYDTRHPPARGPPVVLA